MCSESIKFRQNLSTQKIWTKLHLDTSIKRSLKLCKPIQSKKKKSTQNFVQIQHAEFDRNRTGSLGPVTCE